MTLGQKPGNQGFESRSNHERIFLMTKVTSNSSLDLIVGRRSLLPKYIERSNISRSQNFPISHLQNLDWF